MPKNKDGWFFTKNIIDEINSVPDELLTMEEELSSELDSKHNLKEIDHLERAELQGGEDLQNVVQEAQSDEESILNADASDKDKEQNQVEFQETEQSKNDQQSIQIQYLLNVNKELESQVADLTITIQQLEKKKQKVQEENKAISYKLRGVETAHSQEIKKNEMLEESLHSLKEQKASIQSNLTAHEEKTGLLKDKNMKLQNTFDAQAMELNEVKKQLEEFEMSVENNRKELEQITEEKINLSNELFNAHGEIRQLRSQLKEVENQTTQLMETKQKLQEITKENNELHNEIIQLQEPLEKIHQLEAEKNALTTQLVKATEEATNYQKKYEDKEQAFDEQLTQLEENTKELEELKKRIESGEFLQGSEYDLYVEAQEKIAELATQNEQLTKEVEYSQREIGEVLLTAKKQASRTLEEAQNEADHLIKSAKLELESMGNKARKILIEVDESKETVTAMYSDLQDKVRQLATGNMRVEFEAFEKQEQRIEEIETTPRVSEQNSMLQ